MIRLVSEVMSRKIIKTDALMGAKRIAHLFKNQDIDCCAVYDDGQLIGIITKNELIGINLNRIAADIMTNKFISIKSNSYLWEVFDLFYKDSEINFLLIEENNQIVGFVTRDIINRELGKHVDLLTGLYKSEYLYYQCYKLSRTSEQVFVIFIDVDNFGFIDKKYGHAIGDEILKKLSQILKESIESDFYLCRYAGDEFAIVTSSCLNKTKEIAEKITEKVRQHRFPNNIDVTVSIGISGFKNKDFKANFENIKNLINKASLLSTKAKGMVGISIFIDEIFEDITA